MVLYVVITLLDRQEIGINIRHGEQYTESQMFFNNFENDIIKEIYAVSP